ncbi:hypothetical protein SARC_11045 [Sphaeroforma arctica JP610]|uniref:Uncharacterized protein n=1 Tax=Sphaeroforma arctica JP610 TaxID=667725 RepID=A0A0L0FI74_9EUKA|nr:hypothetical protein SARC_11045 [Sphaeroforma arctica JP610]KNC76455.1 hypothetical protein SARC_11045 [Sphaeroforma arctica JP610]|eukprot:XP_014150357.1 hypothetical protein SARC_11045 [Sphaeroforma arctica JP610]
MSNLRQSRRQQHLTPERREEDDIDRRGTKRRQSFTGYTDHRAEKERMEPQDGAVHSQAAATDRQASKTPRGAISLTQEDVVINDEAKGDSDRRADREQFITSEQRRRDRRRSNIKGGTARGQSSTQKLTERMAQQQSVLEKYEQRLQHTSSELPTTLLYANEASTSPHKRERMAQGREDNPKFRIQGPSQQHHGLGYKSSGSAGQLSEEEDTLSSLEEDLSFQEFARDQVLVK